MTKLIVDLKVEVDSSVDLEGLAQKVAEEMRYSLTEGYNQDGDGRYSFPAEMVLHALTLLAEKTIREVVEEDCFHAEDGWKMIETGENRQTAKGVLDAEEKLKDLRVGMNVVS